VANVAFCFCARSRTAPQVVLLVALAARSMVQYYILHPSSCGTLFFWDNVPLFSSRRKYLKKIYLLIGWVAVFASTALINACNFKKSSIL
jgi:hypothetical protein